MNYGKLIIKQDKRIRELEAALRKLIKGYVNTLESGAIAIQAYGGKCDSVEVMEAGDPWLIEAQAVMASASETACVHDWKNIGPGGFEMPVVICSKCGASDRGAKP